MKKNWLFIAMMGLIVAPVSAQNFEYSSGKVIDLDFNGDLTVRRDDGTGPYDGSDYYYDASGAAVSQPVAYVSGNKMSVDVQLSYDCDHAPDSLFIRAWGPDSFEFLPAAAYLSGSPGSFVFTRNDYEINVPFTPNQVGYFRPFVLHWEYSLDGVYWFSADSTANTVWVVKDNPMSETSNFRYWETVYEISCKNAVGMSTEGDIIDAVWSEYLDHVVLNYNGDSLFYYKDMGSPNVTLASLLKYRDAECFTFTQLFLATMKIQGISKTGNYLNITPNTVTKCGRTVNRFLVKSWTFGTPSATTECPDLPYKNKYTSLLNPAHTAYAFTSADVTDATGLPGMCNPNPSSYFNNHQIAYVNGMYYDPNLGVAYPTLEAYTAAGIDAWSARYNSGGQTHALFTPDLSITSFSTYYTTY